MEEATGVAMTAVPGANLMDRTVPLKNGEVAVSWYVGDDAFIALEGALAFDQPEWGPQSLRAVWISDAFPQGWATADDSGIDTWADLRGKKVARYPATMTDEYITQGLWAYSTGHPDYPALSWDDVIEVPVSGYDDGVEALLVGAVDVAVMSALGSDAYEMEGSIHGVDWLPLPNETEADKAAWASLQAAMPALGPVKRTDVPGATVDDPAYLWGVTYIVVTYDFLHEDDNLIHWFTKNMNESRDCWKDMHAYNKGSTLDWCLTPAIWFTPWHEGAIRYFKEIGRWTPEMQTKQEQMLQRYPQTNTR